jgi:hypothetical protein
VRIGAPDPTLTPVSGMVAVTELVERLEVIGRWDAAIEPIKLVAVATRLGAVGRLAAAQLAGKDFLVGLDRQRGDRVGQALVPVPGLCVTTAAGLARRLSDTQWAAVETGLGDVHAAALATLAAVTPARAAALGESVTIDLDTTDVKVYGRCKRGVAFNHQGPAGRPPARRLLGGHGDGTGRGPAGGQRGSPPRRARPVAPGVWPRCPLRRGPVGSGCAPTPATSPAS